MALVLADRVKETSLTAGTGALTLAGASIGFQSFAAIGNGNTTYYAIVDTTANTWEVGIGTYASSGTTLTRNTVLSNSLGTTAFISFAANSKDVFVTYPANYATVASNNFGTSGQVLTSNGASVAATWQTIPTVAYTRNGVTATAAQTTFTVAYTVGLLQVYVNGVMLNGADYTATNGTSFVLSVGCNAGDIVEWVAFNGVTIANTVTNFSGGTTGLTPSSPTVGAVTLSGTLAVANGGTGVTTSTGSGANVLGTSPTLTTPTITSFVAQNSNTVTTPYSDAGLIPGELMYRLNASFTGSLTTAAQPVLGVGITVSGSTVYQFEALYAFSKTGGAAGIISTSFGGTATIGGIGYEMTRYFDPSALTTVNTPPASYNYFQVATAVTSMTTSASTTTYQIYKLRGWVSFSASGTFIPQITTSTAAAGTLTIQANSFFKLSPVGPSGANTNIGAWA